MKVTSENAQGGVLERSYGERMAAEHAAYTDLVDVHDLPRIFHYWSRAYLGPMLTEMGWGGTDELFATELFKAARSSGVTNLVSLGSGNCDTEIRVAKALIDLGLSDFTLRCFDVNSSMLERGRVAAEKAGLSEVVLPQEVDLNEWEPDIQIAGVMANQSLHHMVGLEHVFRIVREVLPADGRFVVSDIIGRNGHLRWPEALTIVQEYWDRLPQPYRFNLQLRRHEYEFHDWDCSQEGFEGIRSQDILPLLLQDFAFESFLAFGNLIDPFIDRSFGHHFDPEGLWDRNFIDQVHARDEAEIFAGRIKPTHMMAVMRTKNYDKETRCRVHLTPENCVRIPD